jgi:outer membrane protein OmpA-like peptidoglycan-associated protein
MRRISSLFISVAMVAGVATFTSHSVASAATAAGVSTTTTATAPAAVSGLTIAGVTSARDGGMYYAYQNASGDNYSLVKQKADKTFDTTFGTAEVVTVPGAPLPMGGGNRRMSIVSDLDNKWWTVSSASGGTGNIAAVATGGATGQPTAQANFTFATLAATCAAALPAYSPSSWLIGTVNLFAKRTSGVWMTFFCSGNTAAPANAMVLVALKNDLSIDTSIPSVALTEAQGSSAQCRTAGVISDPTGPAGSPEIWVSRQEHTKLNQMGTCFFPSAASDVSGYDILRISSTGVVTRTAVASAGDAFDARFSLRLDAGGRPLMVGASYADTSKLVMARLKTDGTLDTSVFASGFTSLPIGAAPAGATTVNATIMGIITSAEKVYISVLLTDQEKSLFSCDATTPLAFGYRTAVLSYANGYTATFGTNGVSDRVTFNAPEKAICTFLSGGSSVANTGSPRIAYTNGTSLFYTEWQRPSDATGGSEGGTGTGGYTKDTGGAPSSGEGGGSAAGRVDKKVYSTRLPAATQADSALRVLTAKQAKDLDIRTNTPKICIALTTSVLMVNPGRCIVRIIDEDTKRVIRTMSTLVKKSEVDAGTTLTTDEPIYFRQASKRLSKNALAQVAELAEAAKDASRVVVIGHSASLGDVSAYSYAISRDRANAVRAALVKAGVKATIEIVAMSYTQPEKTAKSEKSQAKNRRAEVYIFPK